MDVREQIISECGSLATFRTGVIQMGAVIECLYHIVDKVADGGEASKEIDWTPIAVMLSESREAFPKIYCALSACAETGDK